MYSLDIAALLGLPYIAGSFQSDRCLYHSNVASYRLLKPFSECFTISNRITKSSDTQTKDMLRTNSHN